MKSEGSINDISSSVVRGPWVHRSIGRLLQKILKLRLKSWTHPECANSGESDQRICTVVDLHEILIKVNFEIKSSTIFDLLNVLKESDVCVCQGILKNFSFTLFQETPSVKPKNLDEFG